MTKAALNDHKLEVFGIEDGYLAACEIIRSDVDLDQTGITKEQILDLLAFLEAGGYQVPPGLRKSGHH